MELVPLIDIPEPPPGSELSETTSPETCPWSMLSTELLLFFSSCSDFICVMIQINLFHLYQNNQRLPSLHLTDLSQFPFQS